MINLLKGKCIALTILLGFISASASASDPCPLVLQGQVKQDKIISSEKMSAVPSVTGGGVSYKNIAYEQIVINVAPDGSMITNAYYKMSSSRPILGYFKFVGPISKDILEITECNKKEREISIKLADAKVSPIERRKKATHSLSNIITRFTKESDINSMSQRLLDDSRKYLLNDADPYFMPSSGFGVGESVFKRALKSGQHSFVELILISKPNYPRDQVKEAMADIKTVIEEETDTLKRRQSQYGKKWSDDLKKDIRKYNRQLEFAQGLLKRK